MKITEVETGKEHKVLIEPVTNEDYKNITKGKFYFDWKTEKDQNVCKLRLTDGKTILGLISFKHDVKEKRVIINLLSVLKGNRGKGKQYDRIAGTLIGFACREAQKHYGRDACVCFIPKTVNKLKEHYIEKYGMIPAGRYYIFLEGLALLKILNEYVP